jgi:rubrerythrin
VIDEDRVGQAPADDFVEFMATGVRAKGSFQCTECGYGVVISATLPLCPMCGNAVWEESPWSPFSRGGELL